MENANSFIDCGKKPLLVILTLKPLPSWEKGAAGQRLWEYLPHIAKCIAGLTRAWHVWRQACILSMSIVCTVVIRCPWIPQASFLFILRI